MGEKVFGIIVYFCILLNSACAHKSFPVLVISIKKITQVEETVHISAQIHTET